MSPVSINKRWAYILLTLCVLGLSAVLLYHQGSFKVPPLSKSVPKISAQSSTSLSPVLGDREDAGRLYYPPTRPSQLEPAVYNQPPASRIRTPLFIGFTQTNDLLLQAVIAYIAAGWPPADMIVVDNSGTMDSNAKGHLSRDNPFNLDYDRLRSRYGLSILQTPTLLSFAQLQNFYLRTAIAQEWPIYFWSHMDVVPLADETAMPYKPLYQRVLDVTNAWPVHKYWALKWFSYDALTLVNVAAWRKIGNWDPFIPYYYADCDAYSRMVISGFDRGEAIADAGRIFDLATTINDTIEGLEALFFPSDGSSMTLPDLGRYKSLYVDLERLEAIKKDSASGRNTWQSSQQGGKDEPWSRDPRGFRYGWWQIAQRGQEIYEHKWGQSECNLDAHDVKLSDMWKSEYQ